MPDAITIAAGVGAGLLMAEALKSLAIDAIHRYADWRLARKRRRIERRMYAR